MPRIEFHVITAGSISLRLPDSDVNNVAVFDILPVFDGGVGRHPSPYVTDFIPINLWTSPHRPSRSQIGDPSFDSSDYYSLGSNSGAHVYPPTTTRSMNQFVDRSEEFDRLQTLYENAITELAIIYHSEEGYDGTDT